MDAASISVDPPAVRLSWPFNISDRKDYSKHTVTNNEAERVTVKMKTNNGRLRMTPSHVIVDPRSTRDISVCCTPWLNFDHGKRYQNQHRVVLQYMKLREDDITDNLPEFWKKASKWRDVTLPIIYNGEEQPEDDEVPPIGEGEGVGAPQESRQPDRTPGYDTIGGPRDDGAGGRLNLSSVILRRLNLSSPYRTVTLIRCPVCNHQRTMKDDALSSTAPLSGERVVN